MKVSYCFFVAVLISAPTLAQDSISPCVLGCVTDAASSAGCTSFIDLDCVCANIDFQTTAATCLQEKCTADEQIAALSVQKQMCASAGATNGPAPTNLPGQPLSTTASALQVTTQAATGSSIVPIPTTLITTTDSAGNVFTVTGEVLVSGNSSTTVPCRTVITTNAAGVTVTSTETGSSVCIRDGIVKFNGVTINSHFYWRGRNAEFVKCGSSISRAVRHLDDDLSST
ncbi:integral membrane protein [Fusarium oxysporum f. sp. phaseoli]